MQEENFRSLYLTYLGRSRIWLTGLYLPLSNFRFLEGFNGLHSMSCCDGFSFFAPIVKLLSALVYDSRLKPLETYTNNTFACISRSERGNTHIGKTFQSICLVKDQFLSVRTLTEVYQRHPGDAGWPYLLR